MQCMQFATPPKITLSRWLFFLGSVPFLELRLVLKQSNFVHLEHRPPSRKFESSCFNPDFKPGAKDTFCFVCAM